MEVRQKSGQSDNFCFKVTSPDFHWTWTGQAVEFGQVQWIPLEVQWTVWLSPLGLAGSGQSLLESVRKGGGV